VSVIGLAARVNITGAEAANDALIVNALAGLDVISASSLAAGAIKLTEIGGADADFLIGSQGDDQILGGDGDDTALMGDGDDTFTWNPGDDNDVVEGQLG